MGVVALGAIVDIIGSAAPGASGRADIALVPGGSNSKSIVEVAGGAGESARQ